MSRAIPHSAGCAGRWSLLAGVTLAGTLLRIWSPGRIGLWRDEAQVLSIASLPTLAEITRFLKTHE